jgi:hypothetical protein
MEGPNLVADTVPLLAARNVVAGAEAGVRAPASPLRPSHYHVDIAAAALRADQPPVPFRYWRLRTIRVPARPGQVRAGNHMLYTRPQAGRAPRQRCRGSSAGQ